MENQGGVLKECDLLRTCSLISIVHVQTKASWFVTSPHELWLMDQQHQHYQELNRNADLSPHSR